MRLHALVALSIVVVVVSVSAQKIAKKLAPADVPRLLQAADAAFAQKRYAATLVMLQRASDVAQRELERALLAAMPAPPAGFIVRHTTNNRRTIAAAGLVVPVEAPIEWSCFQPGTQASCSIALHRGGSMAEVVRMGMALADKDPEVDRVVYEGLVAVLRRNEAGRLELRAIIGDTVLIASSRALTSEQLLAVVNQAFVDRLGKLLVVT